MPRIHIGGNGVTGGALRTILAQNAASYAGGFFSGRDSRLVVPGLKGASAVKIIAGIGMWNTNRNGYMRGPSNPPFRSVGEFYKTRDSIYSEMTTYYSGSSGWHFNRSNSNPAPDTYSVGLFYFERSGWFTIEINPNTMELSFAVPDGMAANRQPHVEWMYVLRD